MCSCDFRVVRCARICVVSQIYNETERDLLAPEGAGEQELTIRESKERGVFVHGLREHIVTSVAGVLACIERGEAHRHYGRTNMNDFSSRSHTILRLTIESKKIGAEPTTNSAGKKVAPKVRVSALNFVDLAGSERMRQTGTVAGTQRQKEGKFINKSLLFLGKVISSLSENQPYIPFRDSKLTRILQSSLGGNSLTAVRTLHAERTASHRNRIASHRHHQKR